MNDDPLTALIHSLSTQGSRRGMVALGLLGLLSGIPSTGAAEKRRNHGRCALIRCVECSPCKRGRCRPQPDGTPCSDGGECRNGRCQH